MESNRTSRSAKRAQAYKNNVTRTQTRSQRTSLTEKEILSRAQSRSNSQSSTSNSESEVKLTVREPKRVKVEPKKVSPEELAEQKARHDRVIKQEQQFKEDQKRRIEEIIEQQKTREQRNKKGSEPKEKTVTSSNIESKPVPKSSRPTSDINKLREELETVKEIDNKIERSQKEKQLDDILLDKKYSTSHSSREVNSNNLSHREEQPRQAKEPVRNSSPRISESPRKQLDYSLETKEEQANSISKNEEQDLLAKIGRINELELTNRINKLTQEVLSDIEQKAQKEIDQNKQVTSKQLNTDKATINMATKAALDNLEKTAIIEQKELKKNKKQSKKKAEKTTNTTKKSKKGNIVIILVLIVSIGVFIYSSINIVKWQKDNNDTKEITEDINEIVEVQDVPDSENVEIIEPQKEVPKSNPYWDYIKVPLKSVDFKDLKSKNNETVGWIQVNGTNINYPFVQTKNNSYYLSHSFDKSTNQAGWVFMDYRNNVQDFDRNNIIYAHGRLDTTMFGSLKNILSSGWLKNKDNYIIWLSTEYENTLWQVFSVYRIKTTNDYIQVDFESDDEFSNFVKMLTNRSAHNFNTTVAPTDKILTLSTCYNQTDKVVLHAKLIKVESRS